MISCELSRNVPTRGRYANAYRPQVAPRKTNHRHRNKRKHIRFTGDLQHQATEWLTEEKLSPELISGRWAVQGTDGVSHEAIYQWIWRGKANNHSHCSLFPSLRSAGLALRYRSDPASRPL